MTVKEVEQLTGMTRANIRYYEMEGLLNPERNANGHREYSKNDVDELNKIKLLRTLYISIEEIKELKANQKNLSEVLEVQLEKLEKERKTIVQAIDVCRMMKDDQVDFRTLNAGYYFAEYSKMAKSENEVLKADQIPQERIPVRRFFARGLDISLYTIVWHAVLIFLLGANPQRFGTVGAVVDVIIVWVIMILFEGILLSCVGTTFGKWIFGIEVTNLDDGRLTFAESCVRCVKVLMHGYGCEIPFYGWWKQWKCYEDCSSGVPLKWEDESCLVLKDKKSWRIAVYILAVTLIVGIEFLMDFMADLPGNFGELTVAEFSENYNELADEYGVLSEVYLDENGEWKAKYPEEDNTVIVEETGDWYSQHPEVIYYVEDGVMKGMKFSGEFSPSLYGDEIQLFMQSYIYAKEPKSVLSGKIMSVWDEIMVAAPMQKQEHELYGVEVNYENLGDMFEFEMKLVE